MNKYIAKHKDHVLYRWMTSSIYMPVLLALVLSLLIGFTVTSSDYHLAIPIALLIPVGILIIKYPFSVLLIWLTVSPFFFHADSTQGRYIYWLLHRAMIPATLILITFTNWVRGKIFRPFSSYIPSLFIVGFLAYTTLNILLLTDQVSQNFIHLYDYVLIPFCIFWLASLLRIGKREIKLLTIVSVFLLLSQTAISLISWNSPGLLPRAWQTLAGARTVGTLDNPAVYTSTIMFVSLVIFHTALSTQKPYLRSGLLILFGGSLFSILFSFSRDGWLGLTVVLIGLLFYKPKIIVKIIIITGIIALILGGLFFTEETTFAGNRLKNTHTVEDRIIQFVGSLRMFLERPLFGWGYRNYDLFMKQFRTNVGNIALQLQSTSHNTYLTILAELGLIGLILYMFPVVWYIFLSLKEWDLLSSNTLTGRRWLIALWLFMLFHFTVNNFIDMIRFHAFGNTMWWMGLGLIASTLHSTEKRTH
jgi:O-antigen ligase